MTKPVSKTNAVITFPKTRIPKGLLEEALVTEKNDPQEKASERLSAV